MSVHRTNNFDFLRLLAALLVLVGHQYVLFDRQAGLPMVAGRSIHVLGLEMFFAISGCLVGRSWINDQNLFRFFTKRILRIFPALIVVCAVSTFILGPALTSLEIRTYFEHPVTWTYLTHNIALYIEFYLPGVFRENPVKAVNGSLWSLPVEFLLYVLTALLGLSTCRLPPWARPSLWIALCLAAIIARTRLAAWPPDADIVVYATSLRVTLDVGVYFLGGAVFAGLPRALLRGPAGLAALGALVLLPPTLLGWLDPLLVPYAVLALGSASWPVLRAFGRFGDFSYGAYLGAFPVQQLVYAA